MLSMINISTALAADRVAFNSEFHRTAFLTAVPEFLNRAKDCRPTGVAEKIRNKSLVLYPGIDFSPETDFQFHEDPPLIIWNHRWGFDKNPKIFFQVLEEIDTLGLDFRLALMGENFGMIPDGFARANEIFKKRIVAFGYVPLRTDYLKHLREGDIIISTAIQENFGMSAIEAMALGCLPLLPDRLAYPEILPEEFHDQCLYKNRHDLREKLTHILADFHAFDETRKTIARKMRPFLWENVINAYDEMLEELGTMRNCRA
jgi:glycosyltransferase involved in cell wall biosynthesis